MQQTRLVPLAFFLTGFLLTPFPALAIEKKACELILERLQKYDDLLNELIFSNSMNSSDGTVRALARNQAIEVAGGELDRIRDAKEAVKRECSRP